jgi:hypothetical protein
MGQTRRHWPTNERAEYTTLPEGSGVILIAVLNFAGFILMDKVSVLVDVFVSIINFK